MVGGDARFLAQQQRGDIVCGRREESVEAVEIIEAKALGGCTARR